MLGTLPLPAVADRNFFEVMGGPYRCCPDNVVGVKLAVEVAHPYVYKIDIRDFSVPKAAQVDSVLADVVGHVVRGERVYVGCMGGKGRTGLFLALLAKAFGVDDPVLYVRRHYYRHAVETTEQKQFVSGYVIPRRVARMIWWAQFKSRLRRRGNLTRAG